MGPLQAGDGQVRRLLDLAVEFREKQGLAPGDCDLCPSATIQSGKYCVGGRYFCTECLIDYVESEKHIPGIIAFRLPVSAEEMLSIHGS